jgi:hypothetical protein
LAYPNPASSQVTVEYNLPPGTPGKHLSLYNAYGQVLRDLLLPGRSGKVHIDVSGLPEGVYFYGVMGVKSGKLMIND